MGIVSALMMVSLDGYFEGINGELDWHVVDDEFHEYSNSVLDSMDTILFGRKTYAHMLEYWPTPMAEKTNPVIADKMNRLPKIVFSESLSDVQWGKWDNATLINGDIASQVKKMKEEGRRMIILGSARLMASFISMELLDECHLIINPLLLGQGNPLFQDIKERRKLTLLNTKLFRSGNVGLHYQFS